MYGTMTFCGGHVLSPNLEYSGRTGRTMAHPDPSSHYPLLNSQAMVHLASWRGFRRWRLEELKNGISVQGMEEEEGRALCWHPGPAPAQASKCSLSVAVYVGLAMSPRGVTTWGFEQGSFPSPCSTWNHESHRISPLQLTLEKKHILHWTTWDIVLSS